MCSPPHGKSILQAADNRTPARCNFPQEQKSRLASPFSLNPPDTSPPPHRLHPPKTKTQYHRCHREAALSLSAAVEGGAVPPPEPRPLRVSLERSSTNPESSRPTSTTAAATAAAAGGTPAGDGGGGGRTFPPPPPPAPPLRRRAMSATLDKVREAMPSASNKKDLVQWFLPSEENRKESLIEAAQAAADAAEEARKNCLACWVALRSSIYAAVQVCLCCGFHSVRAKCFEAAMRMGAG